MLEWRAFLIVGTGDLTVAHHSALLHVIGCKCKLVARSGGVPFPSFRQSEQPSTTVNRTRL